MRTQQNIALSDVGKIFSVPARGDVEALSRIEINILPPDLCAGRPAAAENRRS